MSLRPTERFSNRVENYVKYRPSYPPALVDLLASRCGLTPDSTIADVGSGTGLLTQLFLQRGYRVYGVEPNGGMRQAGERFLQGYPGFTSVAATAESTTLPDSSIDLVTAGQAFHWFDFAAARREFVRILKPGSHVALIWNDRQNDATSFLHEYESLLETYCADYGDVKSENLGEADFAAWFGGEMQTATFDNSQRMDFEGLRGRLLSSSYAPLPGHPNFEPMMEALRQLFERYQVDGHVDFLYTTVVYFGSL